MSSTDSIRPFRIDFPEESLQELRRRLAVSRWPDRETVSDRTQGAQLAKVQAATLNQAGGQIACRFHSRDLHLVKGPSLAAAPVRFRVLLDGQPPEAAHGIDADGQGYGTMTGQRLHQLVRQPGPVTDRIFEVTFLDPGVQAYVFTFG